MTFRDSFEMMQSVQPSTLCKDIFELEKDFRYNLFLLKLRDTEITRCKSQNEQLLHELKQKDREISDLRVRLHDLEIHLTATNSDNVGMKICYEDTIANLTSQLEDLRKTHDQYVRKQRNFVKTRESEIEKMFQSAIEAQEKTHQREIEKINSHMQKEKCLIKKAKNDLENSINENISLRRDLQEKQSLYISKISVLESELKTVRDEKVNVEIKLNAAQKDCQYFETELKKTITEKDQVKQELSDSDERNRNSRRKLNEISEERDQLKQGLNKTTADLKTCFENLQTIKEQNCQLQSQFENSQKQLHEFNTNLNTLQQYKNKYCFLEKELLQIKTEHNTLNDEYNKFKEKFQSINTTNSKLISENEYYKQQVLEQHGTNYLKNLERITQQNLDLSAEIEQYKQDKITGDKHFQALNNKLIEVQNVADHFKNKFEYYKKQLIPGILQCTIPDHGKIDSIIQQNSILQEVVKSLRRERSQVLDAEEMERKIERLENVVARFKASILNSVSCENDE